MGIPEDVTVEKYFTPHSALHFSKGDEEQLHSGADQILALIKEAGYLSPDEVEAKLNEVRLYYKDPEYDPQAREFGWFLSHGWIPPEEAKKYVKLTEVGKWINDHSSSGHHKTGLYTPITWQDIEEFEQGRMPKQDDGR